MKKKLLLCFGFIVALPCFASTLNFYQSSIHQRSHAYHNQPLKNHVKVYSTALLTPVSVVQTNHNSWDMNFKPEKFDIVRFASDFNSQGHDAILNFILAETEARGYSDLTDHPVVVPIWVSWGSKSRFNNWVQVVQSSSQNKIKADFSTFTVRGEGDVLISEPYCRNHYGPPSHITISSASSPGSSFFQAKEEEYAIAGKLPPVPVPSLPLPPRFSIVSGINDNDVNVIKIVKIESSKLPPVPVPSLPLPPRFSIVVEKNSKSANVVKMKNVNSEIPVSFSVTPGNGSRLPLVFWGDSSTPLSAWSVISNGEIQENFSMELYFVVVSVVTPEKKRLFKEHLQKLKFEQQKADRSVHSPYEEHYYMEDWYGDEEVCDNLIETAFILPAHSFYVAVRQSTPGLPGGE